MPMQYRQAKSLQPTTRQHTDKVLQFDEVEEVAEDSR